MFQSDTYIASRFFVGTFYGDKGEHLNVLRVAVNSDLPRLELNLREWLRQLTVYMIENDIERLYP